MAIFPDDKLTFKRLFILLIIAVTFICSLLVGTAIFYDFDISADNYSINSTTADGALYSYSNLGENTGETWADARDETDVGAGQVYLSQSSGLTTFVRYRNSAGKYTVIRAYYFFPSPDLNEADNITDASIFLRGSAKQDDLASDVAIFAASPSANTSLTRYDIDLVGETEFSNRMDVSDFDETDWNEFVLNASGIAWINKNSTTAFCIRDVDFDVDDVAPTVDGGVSSITLYFAESEYKPYLHLVVNIAPVIPDNPTGFTLTDLGAYGVYGQWTNSDNSVMVMKRGEYPASLGDGETIVNGDINTANISGLALDTHSYYFRVWAYNETNYSVGYAQGRIGGEMVEDVTLMLAPLIVGMILIFISIFIKSPLIKIAIICCFFGVVITPEFNDTWVQAAAVIIMIWATLSGLFRIKENIGGA